MAGKCKNKMYIYSLNVDKKRSKNRGRKQLKTGKTAFLRGREVQEEMEKLLQQCEEKVTGTVEQPRSRVFSSLAIYMGKVLGTRLAVEMVRAKAIGISRDPSPTPLSPPPPTFIPYD